MQLTTMEKKVLVMLNEVPVREPFVKTKELFDGMDLQGTLDKFLRMGLIEEIQLPPHSGKAWYVHTFRVNGELFLDNDRV